MATNRILKKDRVLSKGGGTRQVILCYDSGLIYQAHNPENIIGVFQSGKGWIVRRQPYYSSGGWGRGSSGDGDGHYLIQNALDLVSAIGGSSFMLTMDEFLTDAELAKINKGIEANNRLIKKQNELARRLGRREFEIDLNPVLNNKALERERKGESIKGIDAVKAMDVYSDAVKVFTERKGKTVKAGDYSIQKDVIKQDKTVVAFRDANGDVFMNSQVLAVSKFEREFMGGQSMIQSEVRKVAKYNIPFNVLASANLKLSETKILEQGPESTHQIIEFNKYGSRSGTVERHFTGALLLENSGRKFLMDIDRIEIQHGLFNAFFVEVDKSVKSIQGAYESMKPMEVRDAEKRGVEVRRQGEWFFIDVGMEVTVKANDVSHWERTKKDDDNHAEPYILKRAVSHGKGRPNNLQVPMNFGPDYDGLVCGVVSHQGREHKDLDLGVKETKHQDYDKRTMTFKLWKLVGNTTVSNFTITGDID